MSTFPQDGNCQHTVREDVTASHFRSNSPALAKAAGHTKTAWGPPNTRTPQDCDRQAFHLVSGRQRKLSKIRRQRKLFQKKEPEKPLKKTTNERDNLPDKVFEHQ